MTWQACHRSIILLLWFLSPQEKRLRLTGYRELLKMSCWNQIGFLAPSSGLSLKLFTWGVLFGIESNFNLHCWTFLGLIFSDNRVVLNRTTILDLEYGLTMLWWGSGHRFTWDSKNSWMPYFKWEHNFSFSSKVRCNSSHAWCNTDH